MIGQTMESVHDTSDDDSVLQENSKPYVSPYNALGQESRKFFNLLSENAASTDDRFKEDDSEDQHSDLNIFLKKTWNIWGVSIIFNFNRNDSVLLKQYAKKLREEIASILSNQDVSYVTRFKLLDVLLPNDTDHPILMIEVYAQKHGDEVKENCIYEGYFISWSSKPTNLSIENTARLPLLLCRGTINTVRAVHSTLGQMFNCTFIALPANSEDLRWLLSIIISSMDNQEKTKNNDEVVLEYSIPYLPSSNSLAIKFRMKTLTKLWNSLWGKKDKIILEEIDKFHEILEQQVKDISQLQLRFCILQRINLPSITISANKIKITNSYVMNLVLTYLNEKAFESLHRNALQFNKFENNPS